MLGRLEKLDDERQELEQQLQLLQASQVMEDSIELGSVRLSMAQPRFSTRSKVTRSAPHAGWDTTLRAVSVAASLRSQSDELERHKEMVKRSRWRNRVNRGGSRAEAPQDHVTLLPRGGVYVQTKHGAVQFGLPPETIKDSLNLGLDVPSMFVVPKDRFNLKYATNTCELEFPAYWNFFVKGRSSLVVASEEAAEVLRKVVDEVLEGPAPEHLYTDEEYGATCLPETFAARPDHQKEIDFFKEPRGGRIISTETLVRFVIFHANADGHMQADLPCEEGTLAVVDESAPLPSRRTTDRARAWPAAAFPHLRPATP